MRNRMIRALRISISLLFAAVLMAVGANMVVSPAVAADDTFSSGNNNQLIIYGMVTRTLLFADDGDRHQLFHVDGGVENTTSAGLPRAG